MVRDDWTRVAFMAGLGWGSTEAMAREAVNCLNNGKRVVAICPKWGDDVHGRIKDLCDRFKVDVELLGFWALGPFANDDNHATPKPADLIVVDGAMTDYQLVRALDSVKPGGRILYAPGLLPSAFEQVRGWCFHIIKGATYDRLADLDTAGDLDRPDLLMQEVADPTNVARTVAVTEQNPLSGYRLRPYDEIRHDILVEALAYHGNVVSRVAESLGMSRSTIYAWMKEFGLQGLLNIPKGVHDLVSACACTPGLYGVVVGLTEESMWKAFELSAAEFEWEAKFPGYRELVFHSGVHRSVVRFLSAEQSDRLLGQHVHRGTIEDGNDGIVNWSEARSNLSLAVRRLHGTAERPKEVTRWSDGAAIGMTGQVVATGGC